MKLELLTTSKTLVFCHYRQATTIKKATRTLLFYSYSVL